MIRPGRLLFRGWFSMTRAGEDLVPPGPFVVAANHFSHLDPVVVALAVRRPVRYLAVDELFGRSRFFDRLTLWMGAVPLARARVPLGALRVAAAELASGGAVGLFPEGVRVWRWGEVEPKRGAAWLARRAGVPLVPVAVVGTGEALGRGAARAERRPIHVEVCPAILPGDFEQHRDPVGAMTAAWRDRVDAVHRRRYGSGHT